MKNEETTAKKSDRWKIHLILGLFLISACSSTVDVNKSDQRSDKNTFDSAKYTDFDNDGIPNESDPCPADPLNDGDNDGFCALVASDLNGDGCVNEEDLDILVANLGKTEEGVLGDILADGEVDARDQAFLESELGLCKDNCPTIQNENQLDSNKDGKGDACADLECAANFCQDNSFGTASHCSGDQTVSCGQSNGCFVELTRNDCENGCSGGTCNDAVACPANFCTGKTEGSHCDGVSLVQCIQNSNGCMEIDSRINCPSGTCSSNQCQPLAPGSSLLMYSSMDSIDKIFQPEFVTEMYPNRAQALPGEAHLSVQTGVVGQSIFFNNPSVQVPAQGLVVLPATNFEIDDPGMDGGRMDFKIKFPFDPTNNSIANTWVMGGWCQYRDRGQARNLDVEIASQKLNIFMNTLESTPFPRRGRYGKAYQARVEPNSMSTWQNIDANEWVHLTLAWRRNGPHKDEVHLFVNGSQQGCTQCSDYNIDLPRIGDIMDYCISPPNYQNDPITSERVPFTLDELRTFKSWDVSGMSGDFPSDLFPEGITPKYPEYWGYPRNGMQVERTSENVLFEFNVFNRQSQNFSCDLYVDGVLSGSVMTQNGAHTEIRHSSSLSKGVHKYQIKCDNNRLVSSETYFCYDVQLQHHDTNLSGNDVCSITCDPARASDPNYFCYQQ